MGSLVMDTLPIQTATHNVYIKSKKRSTSKSPVRRPDYENMGDSYDIPTPLQNIGCQDLLEYKCSHCGWLRKRRTLLNNILNWPQAYVVLHTGCLYYFKNEKARSASGKYSLYGYNSVFRASEIPRKEAAWSFKIVHSHEEFKTYFFSASSEQEMKVWMSCIKKEMLNANGKSAMYGDRWKRFLQGDTNDLKLAKEKDEMAEKLDDSSFYQDIETNIYDGVHKFEISKDYQKQTSIKKQNEDSDDEDLIDKRPPLPLPVDQDPFCSYRKTMDVSAITPPKPKRAPDITTEAPRTPPRHRANISITVRDEKDSPEVQNVKSLAASLASVISTQKSPRLKRRIELVEGAVPIGSYEKTDVAIPASPIDHTVDFRQIHNSGSGGSTGEEMRESCQYIYGILLKEDAMPDLEEYWASIHFDDNDKQRATDIITELGEEGVYLVRPENTGTGKVLVVLAQGKTKKYRIQTSPDGEYFLAQNGFHDKCLENLLCFYYEQELPTVSTKLKIPYKLHRKYKHLKI